MFTISIFNDFCDSHWNFKEYICISAFFIYVVISLAVFAESLTCAAVTPNAMDVRAYEAACAWQSLVSKGCCSTQYRWTHHSERGLSSSCTYPPFCTLSSSNRNICKYIYIYNNFYLVEVYNVCTSEVILPGFIYRLIIKTETQKSHLQ